MILFDYEKYGKIHPIQLEVRTYLDGNLYVRMVTWEEGYPEPWQNLTVNLEGLRKKDCAFIDTNNNGDDVAVWIIRHGLAIPTGSFACSGFCKYPEYRFRADKLMESDPEGYARYLQVQEAGCRV